MSKRHITISKLKFDVGMWTMWLLGLLTGLVLSTIASAQMDTTDCILRIDNTKRCTSKQIRGYEVTTRPSEYEDIKHVSFLRENKKRIRNRKNRCVYFVESLM